MSYHPPAAPRKKPEAGGGKAVSKAELEALREKVAALAVKQPQKAATILTDWVHKGQVRTPSRKKSA
jgi:flagellar biosynthesis/type III secretory pathway M-ring protein FliF/YscJ